MTNKIKYAKEYEDGQLVITAYSRNKKVGHLNAVDEGVYFWVSSVLVYPKYQRQGIATKMYLLAQETIKKPLRATDAQSDDAVCLYNFFESFPDIILYNN